MREPTPKRRARGRYCAHQGRVLPEEEQHPHNTSFRAEHKRRLGRYGQTQEGRNQMTFEQWEDEQNENERLWQDWDTAHMSNIADIGMTFAMMVVNPNMNLSIDAAEIAMEALIESMDWTCPNGTLDGDSTYTQAVDRANDHLLHNIRELKKRGAGSPDTGWWGKELR